MSDSREPQAQCAHQRVSYRTETFEYEGPDIPATYGSCSVPIKAGTLLTRGWWECDSSCGTRFHPAVDPTPEVQE